MMKVWELKKFLCQNENELNSDDEVVIKSIISGGERYCSKTSEAYFKTDEESGKQILILVPSEISIEGYEE